MATAYLSAHGWMGARGICRLCTDSDLPLIRTREAVIGKRPRGILSGFLVVVPGGSGVWVPPSRKEEEPSIPVRMRLTKDVRTGGFIASAYMYKGEYVVEDMLVWRDEPVFYCRTFPERWTLVQEFFTALASDPVLQGGRISPASYILPSAVSGSSDSILEWVPYSPNQKRLIFVATPQATKQATPQATKQAMPQATKQATGTQIAEKTIAANPNTEKTAKEAVVARKDPAGPDVYQLWRGTTHLGQALVRTLAISKGLRGSTDSDVKVTVELNKAFAKWEIMAVL